MNPLRVAGVHAVTVWGLALGLPGACAGSAPQTAGALASYVIHDDSAETWRLPGRLREISGLAATADGRIFAHDDETGIIYEFDPRAGALVKAWAMGDPVPSDDFEGIAVAGDRIFLVTSSGRIYETREGNDGDRMLYNEYGTHVGAACEVEGLAFEPADQTLLLLCKSPRQESLADTIAIFRWSLVTREITDTPIRIPLRNVTRRIGGRTLHPSGIERHPETGTYFIVAAREAVLVEIDRAGAVQGVRELRRRSHPQSEGITFTPDGRLFLADEGQNRRGRIKAYRRRASQPR